jgi:hypothetical protein
MTLFCVRAKELDLAHSEELLANAEEISYETGELIKIRREKLHCAKARVRVAKKMAEK